MLTLKKIIARFFMKLNKVLGVVIVRIPPTPQIKAYKTFFHAGIGM